MSLKKIFPVLLAVVLAWSFAGWSVQADQHDSGFNAGMIPNDHQRTDRNAWFDLKLAPGEQTTLAVALSNRSTRSATFQVATAQAQTHAGMQLSVADQQAGSRGVTASGQGFGQPLQAEQDHVTLAPGQSTKLLVKATMPKQAQTGSWLGGIRITKELTKQEQEKAGFTNRFSYLAYVQLSNTDQTTKPALALDKVSYEASNSQMGALHIGLRNQAAGFMGKGHSVVKIFKKGQAEAQNEYKNDNQAIANSSIFTYRVPTQALSTGQKYQADITIWDNQTGQVWHFKQDFTVPSGQAGFTRWVTDRFQDGLAWYYWLLALVLLLLLGYLGWRHSRRFWVQEVLADGQIVREKMTAHRFRQLKRQGRTVCRAEARYGR
ncbi:DUF3324 domain-containing protein [Leuconostocaceae bacterium ESL0958]|nr:DUF3324 domain-containing protein [Leuconostocaceae bacterium ESL0958]